MNFSKILDTGKQALAAQMQAIETTGRNIANASVPGYSRQRIELKSASSGTDNSATVLESVRMRMTSSTAACAEKTTGWVNGTCNRVCFPR